MKRTGVFPLAAALVLGLIAGFATDQILTWLRQSTFTPAITLPILLVLLAAACLFFAWPIRQQLRGRKKERVDSIQAFRIVTLARASSIVGAATAGFAAGLMAFLLTRPATPPVDSMTLIGVTIGAAIVLAICALIAESFCVLPKDDDDQPHTAAGS